MSNNTTAYTEQSLPDHTGAEPDFSLAGFFAIGMVVNLVLITAYFIWAYKQWGKKDKNDE